MTTALITPEPAVAAGPRARLEALFDPDAMQFVPGDVAVVVAHGLVGGVPAIAFATDHSLQGGALGAADCGQIVAAYEAALRRRVPIIGIWQSGGACLSDGVASLDGIGRIFAAMTRASGKVPQISLVLGPAAGGAAYGPALTDVVVLGPHARVFVTGPDVVRSVTGEVADMARLGGPDPHGRRSGLAHITTASDSDAFAAVRSVTALLGRQGSLGPVVDREFGGLLPDSARRAYDVLPLVARLFDGAHVELHRQWAPNVVTSLGRLAGRTVGVIATNPLRLGGCLDAASAEKAARFVRLCDAFGIPLVVVVDVPGYLPGLGQEWDGVVRRGAKLLHAFAEAVVPRVTVITRKAYGGAYIALNSRALGATRVFAWPDAEVAVMGTLPAVRILHRRKLASMPEAVRPAAEAALVCEHERQAGGLSTAIELGCVDEVIEPGRTRTAVARALVEASASRGKHGNIPL